MSSLWLMMTPVAAAIYTLLLPIAPNDFWYHVRAGEVIVTARNIPATALFSSSVSPGTPYFYQSWIAEVLLFQTLHWGGLDWIAVLRAVCLTAAFVLITLAAWRRIGRVVPNRGETTRARITALSTLLAFALSASNMDVRPQTFSVPLFALFAFLIFEWPFLAPRQRKGWVTAAGILMLLWVNTHGAFFTGLVLLGAFLMGEFFQSRFRPRGSAPTLHTSFFLFAVCALATFFNPRGPGIYSYVFELARLEAGQKFIQEWQVPSLTDWYGTLFFLSLLLVAVLMGVLWRLGHATKSGTNKNDENKNNHLMPETFGARPAELLILSALAIMALRDIRSIIWFGLFLAPILAGMSARLLATRTPSPKREEGIPRAAQIINGSIACLLLLSIIPVLPWLKPQLPLPLEYAQHFVLARDENFPVEFSSDPPLLLDRDTPVEAVEFLRRNPPRGLLWNDFVYGSYLVWATRYSPRLAPHADPRVEMHSLAFWEEYGRLCEGPRDAARTLAMRGFSDAILNVREQSKLLQRLREAGWQVVFAKNRSIVVRHPKS